MTCDSVECEAGVENSRILQMFGRSNPSEPGNCHGRENMSWEKKKATSQWATYMNRQSTEK